MVSVYRKNNLNQALALRAHYLPNEDDSLDNLARAIWLRSEERRVGKEC